MNRSAVRWLAGIFVTLLLLVVAGGAFLWWKIAQLKEQLVADLGKAIGAQVQITSIHLDVWKGELNAAGITLTNVNPAAPWEKGAISQATVRFQLADLFAPSLPLTVDVGSWSVVLHPYSSTTPETASNEAPAESSEPSLESGGSKSRIHVTQLSAHEGSVDVQLSGDQDVLIHGVSFVASDNGAGVWSTELQATSVAAGSLQAGATSVQIRGVQDSVSFSNLHVQCDQGLITGDGEVALTGDHHAQMTLQATDVPVSMLVAVQWQMKLSGLVSGDLAYNGNDQAGSANGHISLNHGKFNVLPGLGKITTLVGLPDISEIEVDKATSDFEFKDHTSHLTNIDVRENDVARITGTLDIDPTGQVDGKLKLGLPSTITAKWPQIQDKVFSVQMDNYNWADVHLTGTPDHLQEDLTPRLLAAGLDTGGGLLDEAAQKASDLFKNFMGK